MKRLLAFASALVISLSSLLAIMPDRAFAATRTWDGGGSDNNFSTDENWSSDTAPVDGDVIVFPVGASISDKTVVNDLTAGTSFAEVDFTGTLASEEDSYTLSGNAFEVVGGIMVTGTSYPTISADFSLTDAQTISTNSTSILTVSGDVNVNANEILFNDNGGTISLSGVLTGSGDITKEGAGYLNLTGDSSSLTSPISIDEGRVYAFGASALGGTSGATTVNDGADLAIATADCSTSTVTVGENITLTGDSSDTTSDIPIAKLVTLKSACSGGGGADENYGLPAASSGTATLTGTLTLGTDITFGGYISTTKITGTISGNHAISRVAGYPGKLVIDASPNGSTTANGTYTPEAFKKTLSNSLPSSSVIIDDTAVITLTGTRGDITISGGTLKGTGTAGSITMSDGTVAPGMSPGTLNSGNVSFTSGTHEVELGGTATSQYDRLNVTGTVSLGTATTLTTTLYNGFEPAVGNTFTIIVNDGSDAVTGTFDDLAEGATFEVDGYVFKISYVGGTGNDVVLTVMSIPTAPDTGFNLIKSNSIASVILLCVVTPGLFMLARRSYLKSNHR